MKKSNEISRRNLLKNVGAVAAVGAFGSSGALIASQTSAAQAAGSGGPRVLVLMGDRYHNQSSIRISLHPIFTELALPVDYSTNYCDLSADLLKPYQLFVCYRDNEIWPGGYLAPMKIRLAVRRRLAWRMREISRRKRPRIG